MGKVQILSYELVKNLNSVEKISKIISIVKTGDIVMLEGKLTPEEETNLISKSMENISGKFSGIEVAHLNSKKENKLIEKLKNSLLNMLAKDRIGITVIGPSKVVKEIKMDPNKLEILF